MKKIIVLLYFAFMVFAPMCAQETSEHLAFKGIVIDGSMKGFCESLEAKGFKSIIEGVGLTVFEGPFTGLNATVAVLGSEDGKIVYGVAVLLEPSGKWDTLVDTYEYYKALYKQKYGNPTFSKEYNPAKSDSNNALMAEVDKGTVIWTCTWDVICGHIDLDIKDAVGINKGQITIKYIDSQNVEIKNKIKNQRDLEDI